MLAILKLILFVLLAVLLWSAFVGAVAFLKDLHRFKNELEFSGTRKDMIKFLTDKEREKNVSQSE